MNMELPNISIIIPIYNAASYLEKCLMSIVKQTYENIEIICVNDGSTDDSERILNEYIKRDTRLHVITQSNKGIAVARSVGLKAASGDYILYVDSDDYMERNALELLVGMLNRIHVDVLGFSYETFPNGKLFSFSMKTEQKMTPAQLLQTTPIPQTSNDFCFVWRYLIRRELITKNKIDFHPQVRIGEDMIFMMRIFSCAKSIYLTNYAPYRYRIDNQYSLMRNKAYKSYLEESFSIMYEIKKSIIAANGWDEITPFSLDLAEYTIKQYFLMFLRNRMAKGDSKEDAIRGVLCISMIREALQIIGFRNVYSNWKEYVLFLCMKFQLVSVLKRYY